MHRNTTLILAVAGLAACEAPGQGREPLTGDFYGTIEGLQRENPYTRTVNLSLTRTASLTDDRPTGAYSGSSCRGAVSATFDVERIGEVVPL